MLRSGLAAAALCLLINSVSPAASLPSCTQGARAYFPCELRFDVRPGEIPASASPFKDELLNVEFRSPRNITYLMREFSDDGHTLQIRFTPTEPGDWTFHVTSSIPRFNDQETRFNVSDSDGHGLVSVAN